MIEIRRLSAGDEAVAIEAIHELKPAEERAGHDASKEHMRQLLARDENYLYIASVDAQPVGFLLAYRFPRVDRDQDMIYLYEITVLLEQRRRGIGSRMIQALKEECRSSNVMEVWVGTEADNAAARALYESTGAKCQGETYAEYRRRSVRYTITGFQNTAAPHRRCEHLQRRMSKTTPTATNRKQRSKRQCATSCSARQGVDLDPGKISKPISPFQNSNGKAA